MLWGFEPARYILRAMKGKLYLLGKRVLLEGERPELFTLVKKHLIRY